MTTQAIDVHGHYGPYLNHPRQQNGEFMSGNVEIVLKRAREAGVQYTIVSPMAAMMPRGGGEPIKANEDAASLVAEHDGLLQWVVVDPRKPETYEQADRMLEHPKCVGIKIHPEEHQYPVAEHGRKSFELAAKHGRALLSHSGEQKCQLNVLTRIKMRAFRKRPRRPHQGHCLTGSTCMQVM